MNTTRPTRTYKYIGIALILMGYKQHNRAVNSFRTVYVGEIGDFTDRYKAITLSIYIARLSDGPHDAAKIGNLCESRSWRWVFFAVDVHFFSLLHCVLQFTPDF